MKYPRARLKSDGDKERACMYMYVCKHYPYLLMTVVCQCCVMCCIVVRCMYKPDNSLQTSNCQIQNGSRPVYVYWWIVRFRLCGHKSFTSSLFDSISLLHFCNVRLRSKVSESRFSGPELGSYRLSPLHVNVFCFQLPTPCYCFQYEIFFNNAVSLRL